MPIAVDSWLISGCSQIFWVSTAVAIEMIATIAVTTRAGRENSREKFHNMSRGRAMPTAMIAPADRAAISA